MNGVAYYILQEFILKEHGKDSLLSKAIGRDFKGKSSPVLYTIAILYANFYPIVAGGIYIFVALMWLIPDSRIERIFNEK